MGTEDATRLCGAALLTGSLGSAGGGPRDGVRGCPNAGRAPMSPWLRVWQWLQAARQALSHRADRDHHQRPRPLLHLSPQGDHRHTPHHSSVAAPALEYLARPTQRLVPSQQPSGQPRGLVSLSVINC